MYVWLSLNTSYMKYHWIQYNTNQQSREHKQTLKHVQGERKEKPTGNERKWIYSTIHSGYYCWLLFCLHLTYNIQHYRTADKSIQKWNDKMITTRRVVASLSKNHNVLAMVGFQFQGFSFCVCASIWLFLCKTINMVAMTYVSGDIFYFTDFVFSLQQFLMFR